MHTRRYSLQNFLKPRMAITLLGCLFSASLFQNCSAKLFTPIDPKLKAGKLAGESIFGPNNISNNLPSNGAGQIAVTPGGSGQGSVPIGGSGSGQAGVPVTPGSGSGPGGLPVIPGTGSGEAGLPVIPGSGFGPGGLPVTPGSGSGPGGIPFCPGGSRGPSIFGNQVGIRAICSDRYSAINGNVAAADSIKVELVNSSGIVECSFIDNSMKNSILTQKQISMAAVDSKCPNLKVGANYQMKIRDANQPASTSLLYRSANLIVQKRETDWGFSMLNVPLLTDYNNGSPRISGLDCDETHSPLVVRFDVESAQTNRCGQDPLLLSAPNKGVLFDILGANSTPSAYTPKEISWASTKQFHFVTLPRNGEVNGINELFGDNTLGPDDKFAADGYAALAKYDGKSADGKRATGSPDGLINDKDPVWSSLRLWKDANGDGIAQKGELSSLSSKRVTAIDLRYDPSYYEMDIYGNEIKYKSVVQTKDGNLHTMFDLWFVLGNK